MQSTRITASTSPSAMPSTSVAGAEAPPQSTTHTSSFAHSTLTPRALRAAKRDAVREAGTMGVGSPAKRQRAAVPTLTSASPARTNATWPSGKVDMSSHLQGLHDGLSTEGRPLPPIDPQTVGMYFKEPIGRWPSDRTKLAPAVNANLLKLANTYGKNPTEQLSKEITLHWHCLCEVEKRNVLDELAPKKLLGNAKLASAADMPPTSVRNWLEHTALFMKPEEAHRLLQACSPESRTELEVPLKVSSGDENFKAMLKERFTPLRMTMPLDHMYDYGGFMLDTNRKYGELPKGVAEKLKVCVVGGGPAGIIAADGLNRLGIRPVVLEQASQIGGRMTTVRTSREDGSMSPTPMCPGAMRFSQIPGNAYWSLVKHYDLQHKDFPNPNTVPTSLIIGNELHHVMPGEKPSDPVMQKVAEDVRKAMDEVLLLPIREARDAGNTAKFRELCDAAKEKFDGHTFRSGLATLLGEQGIQWNDKEWQTFNAVGIGVGGYEGYNGTGFLEEFRFIVDERLEGHQALENGPDAPLYEILKDENDLPAGIESLEKQQAVRLGIEVKGIDKKEGQYHVTYLDKNTGTENTEKYDELFFAAGPREAVALGLTNPVKPGSEPMVSPEFATALEKANVVGATKMILKVPQAVLAEGNVPGNIQGSKLFQQSYVVPPFGDSENSTVYWSYTLGDNASKVVGIPSEQQLEMYANTLRSVASQRPDSPRSKGVANLADILEKADPSQGSSTHWSLEKHYHGAFKMDEPNQLNNTRELFKGPLTIGDGAIFINEENTAEGGFASGAIAAAINGVQQLVKRHGGTLPPNSPFEQKIL